MAILVVKKSIMHRYQNIGQAIQEAEAGDFIEIRMVFTKKALIFLKD